MLTRRENLLIRPWQERRYIHHRQKVRSALPVVDNTPPPCRDHVSFKMKKIQRESERCVQIISDNFTLLQHLSKIMKTTRIDHFWEESPPNFLRRVGIYTHKITDGTRLVAEEREELPPAHTRRDKCAACSPQRFIAKFQYDVRRPYTPPKARISKKSENPDYSERQSQSRCDEDRLEFRGQVWSQSEKKKKKQKQKMTSSPNIRRILPRFDDESQSVVLTTDGLSVSVKFPSRTDVVYNSAAETKIIKKNLCECKTFREFEKKKLFE